MRSTAIALTVAAAVARPVDAQIPLRITTPQPVAADTFVPIEFEGEQLDSVSAVILSRAGSGAVSSTVLAKSPNSLLVSANLVAQPVGLYTTTLVFQSGHQESLHHAMEVSRAPGVLVSGQATASNFEPLAGPYTQSNSEYLVELPVGPQQEFVGLSFFLAPGSPAPTGSFTIRHKAAAAVAFDTTALDGADSGWRTDFQGPCPAPTDDGEIFFGGSSTILPAGQGIIHLSVCHSAPASSATLLQWTSTARSGRRGVARFLDTPPEDWGGTVPSQRSYLSRMPVMRFYFAGNPVSASFESSAQRILPGTEVRFTNTSTSNTRRLAWDLNGDGIQDATGEEATQRYDRPGRYTVVLTVGDGYAEDAETKVDLIEVIDPATLGQDQWMVK